MTIVHVFASFPNASQPYNLKLITRLMASQVDCKIITFGKSSKHDGLKVHSFKHYNYRWLRYVIMAITNYKLFLKYKKHTGLRYKKAIFYFGRYSTIIRFTPNIIHVHHIQVLQLHFISFLDILNIKHVVSVRGSDVLVRPYRSKKEMAFLLNVFENISYVHTVSEHLKISLDKLNKKTLEFFVIRRTVEVDSIIDDLSYKNNCIKITTIGRLHWTKGYRLALEALFILKNNNIDFEYHICGSYTDEQFDELKFYINYMGLEKYVTFHGHLNSQDLDQMLSQTTIYLQSSLTEGIPNTLLRALFYRIPIVTSNAGGIPEVFRNKIDGLMVKKGDSIILAKSLEKLINNKELMMTIRNSSSPISSSYMKEINAYKAMYIKIGK